VWTVQLGDTANVTRYTDFAAAPPKLAQINALFDKTAFPAAFSERKIRFRVTRDHKTIVYLPLAADERIYGYGLQFDGTRRNGRSRLPLIGYLRCMARLRRFGR